MRMIPFTAMDHEKWHGRYTTWILRPREAPVHIKENWPGCIWIVELITTSSRNGKPTVQSHYFLTTLRASLLARRASA